MRFLFWRRKKRDEELDAELRSHLDMAARDRLERGEAREQARDSARREMGNVSLVKETTRDIWGWRWLADFTQDLRFALRMLKKNRGFSVVAILTLALGIGATTSIFSVVDAVVLRSLPYREPAKLALLTDPQDRENGGFLLKDFDAFKKQGRSFDDLAIFYRDSGFSRITLTDASEPEQVQGAFVSSSFFPLMGVSPILGRVFSAEEVTRRERVVVLSHRLWLSQFGGAGDVIGKMLRINQKQFQVIGVMPEEFQFPARDQVLWAPITTNDYWDDAAVNARPDPSHGRYFFERWQVIGRLRRDLTLQQAQLETDVIFSGINQADPDTFREGGVKLVPLRVELGGNTRLALIMLLGAVGFVLFIACSNVANMSLARGTARRREIAVRSALGAGHGRLARQLLTEGVVLALIASVVGVGLAAAAIPMFIRLAPTDIPRLEQTSLNSSVLIFALVMSILSAILFGLLPALRISRRAGWESLNLADRGGTGAASLRSAQGLLMICEFSLAVVLLTGAGLLVRSFVAVESVDLGFRPDRVLTMRVTKPNYSHENLDVLHDSILKRLQALPKVEAVGAVNDLFEPSRPNILGLRAIEGRTVDAQELWSALIWKSVSGDYFQTIGTPLLKGRYFSDADGPNSPRVAVIDESMARRYWPNEDPVGARIKGQDRRGRNDDWVTVIGVVRDARRSGPEYAPSPHVFEWYRQAGVENSEDIVVRTAGDPGGVKTSLRSAVRSVAPNTVLSPVETLEERLSELLAPRRFQASLLSVFAVLALILAAIGIFGLMSYNVSQRTREFGIRIALGAQSSDVLSNVLAQALQLTLAGICIGVAGSLLLARLIKNLLFSVNTTDPATLIYVSLLLGFVAAVASYVPARRAMRVDPMVALRHE